MKPEIEYVYNKLKKLRFDFNAIDFRDFRNEYRYESTLKRYVRKDDNDLFIDKNTFKPLEEELEYADKCHNLEEQIGCSLEVMLKALEQQKIFVEHRDIGESFEKDVYVHDISLAYANKEFCFMTVYKAYGNIRYRYIPLKDYRKNWWLKSSDRDGVSILKYKCPKCNSDDIEHYTNLNGEYFECLDCGYSSQYEKEFLNLNYKGK